MEQVSGDNLPGFQPLFHHHRVDFHHKPEGIPEGDFRIRLNGQPGKILKSRLDRGGKRSDKMGQFIDCVSDPSFAFVSCGKIVLSTPDLPYPTIRAMGSKPSARAFLCFMSIKKAAPLGK